MNRKALYTSFAFIVIATTVAAQVPVTAEMNVPNLGKKITPLAQRGSRFSYLNPHIPELPDYVVGQAVHSVVSPDHKTLLILTSGYNAGNDATGKLITNNEWVFIFDITSPLPVQKQAIAIPNTYNGIVFDPSGTTFYVAGGQNDNVHIYDLSGAAWAERLPAIALSHTSQAGGTKPASAGIDITKDGKKIIVTNYENDSVTVLNKNETTGAWTKGADFDLRPGKINTADKGVPGGALPFWVTIKGNTTAYVSSIRDREIDVLDITTPTPTLIKRVKVTGQPLKSILNAEQTTLYVAEDQSDSVGVINTTTNSLDQEVKVVAPNGVLSGALASLSGQNTNSVTLSPDETKLYLTNGNTNSIAVLNLPLSGGVTNNVIGLIPTAMYPTQVNFSADGKYMYVINGRSPSGPNAGYCRGGSVAQPQLTADKCAASNGYTLQTVKAGLGFIPTPTSSQLTTLTQQVAANNNYDHTEDPGTKATMDFLHDKIKHVIYIVRENRTYDQVLGDLPIGNGDPSLTEFPASVTPNMHQVATDFVDLDNFYDSAEDSYDGWVWSTAGYTPDIIIRQHPVNYSPRGGLSKDGSDGTVRGISLLARTGTNASDPDVLPGLTNPVAPDGPNNQINTGYFWDGALRAGLTLRNYGFFVTDIGNAIPNAFASQTVQVNPSNPALAPNTDLYFRGYDLNMPDFYLYQEWGREFDGYVANNNFPSVSLVRLPHDHTGNFGTALAGVNTPERQVADNDYAVALMLEKISKSPYADSTLVFVLEDDSQDGGDHVDAHRSVCFVVGPYVKKHAVVSTQYNTINVIHTMERILGVASVNLNDAVAQPMADIFDISQGSAWTFHAVPAAILYGTTLPLPPPVAGLKIPKPTHDAAYWAKATKGFNLAEADAVEPESYNRVLWEGLMKNRPYPGDASLAVSKQRYKEAKKLLASGARFDDDDK